MKNASYQYGSIPDESMTLNQQRRERTWCDCSGKTIYALAFLVSVISWITCIALLSTVDELVDTYTFDTKLALFVTRPSDETCSASTTTTNASLCPLDVVRKFETDFDQSPCSSITPRQVGSPIRWGNISFTRYPIVTASRTGATFWGRWLHAPDALVLLLIVYTISALFQAWRYFYYQPRQSMLEHGEACCYDSCQHDPLFENESSWAFALRFQPDHGAHWDRWIEYTLTASLQIVVVALNFQGSSVNELWFLGLLQGMLTLLGFIVEDALDSLYGTCQHKNPRMLLFGQARFTPIFLRAVVTEILAWFVHACLWTTLFAKFDDVRREVDGLRTQKTQTLCVHSHDIPGVPGWVQAILYSQFVFFTLFGCTQLFQFLAFANVHVYAAKRQKMDNFEKDWRKRNQKIWSASAGAYAMLNVLSKFCLALILISGAAMR